MKKILLSAIVIISAYQLKAQQLPWLKPADTLSNGFGKSFKLKPGNQFQLFGQNINPNKTTFLSANINQVDNMPIVILDGYDKMPIVKLAGYDNMAIKLLGVTDPATWMKTIQNLPSVKNPRPRPYVTQLY
jgi:hypothetical protein